MDVKGRTFPRILLRTPTADGALSKVVSGVAGKQDVFEDVNQPTAPSADENKYPIESHSFPELGTTTANTPYFLKFSLFPSLVLSAGKQEQLTPLRSQFNISSSSSLTSNDPSPRLSPTRSPLSHQRSISLVDPPSQVPLSSPAEQSDDSSRRPRGMSLPFGSSPQDGPKQRRRGMSFLNLHPGEGGLSALYNQLQHLPVPTLTISAPAGEMGGRKFSFGLRRLSQTTLNRSDSMISLCFRSLVNFITEDNLPGLKSYLDSKKAQVDDKDENNATALIVAATQGKLIFVRELIRYGADVNAEDADNWSALLCAAKEGHLDICRELLDHGALVDHRDMASWTPLLWAAYKGRTAVAELLIERHADVNAHENYHISPLHWACGRGHVQIARMLVAHGAKVNVGDKYGTTPLIWACRKGTVESVEMLLKAGAHVDASGMNSWTPLLVATAGNHVEVANILLEHKPNVNALDKDGYTALAIACKEGFNEIAQALLLAPGIYVNLQDRSGDTNLIHAVKAGHRGIVEALLKKYADINIQGKDKKTPLYTAVEKGHTAIVKILLSSNPDLEVTTKDGDTALLRAVRTRNTEVVQMLVDKKAKVSATDKKGDTALHIAMRARSKAIVEILLRNPKHSQLLYRPNRSGETPYNIDINHQKTILGQIFGRLNTNEENENLLGYDLYSSALADILSEPSLSMPITVGLYARWGSGKSFLLTKLREEMKNFARQWVDPSLHISTLLVVTLLHIAATVGVALGVVTSWLTGVVLAAVLLFLAFTFLIILWSCNKRNDWNWPYQASVNLAKHMNSFRLVIQVMFCNPPNSQSVGEMPAQPIRFYFTDQARISNTTGSEHYVSQMLGSLYDSIEADYGWLATRLYRAFRPPPQMTTSSWKWRKACCLPYIVIFEIWITLCLVEVIVVAAYFHVSEDRLADLEEDTLRVMMIIIGTLLSAAVFANTYTISHLVMSLIFSQRRHLQRTIARHDLLKTEGFLPALKKEVSLMSNMVKCLDALTDQQSRLVVVVDGLDSCEQDKVLMVLDTVHLLSDVNSPFIVVLAIDPHIIAKAVEMNSRRLITENNINGHEYLRNMVHLPFFLANSALRRVKVAQNTSRRSTLAPTDMPDDPLPQGPQLSARRLSVESTTFTASAEKLKLTSRKGSRKLKMSESIASSIGSNLNKICGAQDLTKMLLTDDYFSDVNPRSMRRLLNVIYVTGRLLKAFQMDFNWYHLALWVNITEQWPYRCSWLIFYYEMNEERLEDHVSLKNIYDEVRPRIPLNKEMEPLLEVDRDEKKFDVFLTYHRSTLLLSDLKVFLPFTINLDPYFKKIIKEDQQEDRWSGGLTIQTRSNVQRTSYGVAKVAETAMERRARRHPVPPSPLPQPLPQMVWTNQGWVEFPPSVVAPPNLVPYHQPLSATSSIPSDLMDARLSSRTAEDVCDLISRTMEIRPESAAKYAALVRANNITGKVLLHCDLNDLKNVLQMTFGDWELFKLLVVSLREYELTAVTQTEETSSRNVRFERKRLDKKRSDGDKERRQSSSSMHTVVENQVTLEDEMICGTLTTLSEEACEDVLEGAAGEIDIKETPVVYLQSSPMSQPTWQLAEDSSAPSSVNATPILHRKTSRRNSRTRPTSLLGETTTPPMSPKCPLVGDSTIVVPTIKRVETSPAVIITSVSSMEKLHRFKDKLLKSSEVLVSSGGNSMSDDDESMPLVAETQDNTSSDASPVSGPKSGESRRQDTPSSCSEMSVGNILDRSKSYDSITSSRSQFGTHDVYSVNDLDLHVRSRHATSPPLVRQQEIQKESSLALQWDSPETSV